MNTLQEEYHRRRDGPAGVYAQRRLGPRLSADYDYVYGMNIRCYLDPATGEPHIDSHGVTEDEVADVLRNPGEDRPGRDKPRHYILFLSGERTGLIRRRESLAAHTI
jgi:hypothetical protein